MGKRGRSRHGGRGRPEWEAEADREPRPPTDRGSGPAPFPGPTAEGEPWSLPGPDPYREPDPAPHGGGPATGRAGDADHGGTDRDGSEPVHDDGDLRGGGHGDTLGVDGPGRPEHEGYGDDEGYEDHEDDEHRTGRGRAERRRAMRRIKRRRRRSAVREVPILIGVALLIALFLKTFLVQAFVIPSGSMEDTIQVGDRVLVDKLTPWFGSEPQRGDVVVFRDPGHWLDGEPQPKPSPAGVQQFKDFFTFIGLLPAANEQDLIKRVIAVGGDEVKCCDPQGRIMVNGQALDEPYVAPGNPPSLIQFDVHVPKGRLWVMGDHRSDSADSRYHMNQPGGGTVAENLVVGRAFVIAWPFSHWTSLHRPNTFAAIPAAGAQGMAAQDTANIRQGLIQLPTPAELPFVMGVVGLYRVRRRLSRSEEWMWGTWWSAHGPDPASPKGREAAHRWVLSKVRRR